MRILHIDTGRQMRGGQWQVLYLLEALRRAGVDAALLARRNRPLYEQAAGRGLDVAPLGISELLRRLRFSDLVHAHDAHAHTLAALLARRPFVVARRVAFPIGRSLLSRWKYSRAAHYIAVSDFVKRTLLEAGVPEERTSVIYDGVPVGQVFPPVADKSDSESSFTVLAPATADPMKGSAVVRQAAALAAVPVRFSENLAADLPGAAALVYITRQEGLGSAVLLAMAAGVPVIASRVGGLPEIVRDGETGLLVDSDPHAVAAALGRLRSDPELARRLAACARRFVEGFSVERMATATIQAYQQVLACWNRRSLLSRAF